MGGIKGGRGKELFIFYSAGHPTDRELLSMVNDLGTEIPELLSSLIVELRRAFFRFYTAKIVQGKTLLDALVDSAPKPPRPVTTFDSHDMLVRLFKYALSLPGWYDDDAAKDRLGGSTQQHEHGRVRGTNVL